MRKYLQTFLSILLCTLMTLSLSACRDSNTFRASKDSTWGDLCRQFQPEWFNALPAEIQQEYDELLLQETPPGNHGGDTLQPASIVAVVPIEKLDEEPEEEEEEDDEGYLVLERDACDLYGEPSDNIGCITLDLQLAVQDKKMDFSAGVASMFEEDNCDLALIVALSDTSTKKYLAVHSGTFSLANDIDWIVSSFENLKSKHDYTVQAIVVAKTSQGTLGNEALYVEKTVTTV